MSLPVVDRRYVCILGRHKNLVVIVTKFNGGQVTVRPLGKVNVAATSHKKPVNWRLPLDAFLRRYREIQE